MLFSKQTLAFVIMLSDFVWLPSQAHPLLRKAPLPASQTLRPSVGNGTAQDRGLNARPGVDTWILLFYLSQGGRLPMGVLKRGQELAMLPPGIRIEKRKLKPDLGLAALEPELPALPLLPQLQSGTPAPTPCTQRAPDHSNLSPTALSGRRQMPMILSGHLALSPTTQSLSCGYLIFHADSSCLPRQP